MFLALTLSALGGTLWRLISCVCTIGILLCLCINYAYNRSEEDRKMGISNTPGRCFFLGVSVSLFNVIWGIGLLLARGGILPSGYYRWYKLLDAPFLQLCNFMSQDVTAAALSWGETLFLSLMNLLPLVTVWVTYTLLRKGVIRLAEDD